MALLVHKWRDEKHCQHPIQVIPRQKLEGGGGGDALIAWPLKKKMRFPFLALKLIHNVSAKLSSFFLLKHSNYKRVAIKYIESLGWGGGLGSVCGSLKLPILGSLFALFL